MCNNFAPIHLQDILYKILGYNELFHMWLYMHCPTPLFAQIDQDY